MESNISEDSEMNNTFNSKTSISDNSEQVTSADLINEEIKANTSNTTISDEKPVETSDLSKEKEEWMDILGSGQLKKKVLKRGEPDTRPQRSDVCKIKLVGKLENNTIVENVECQTINIGDAEVVQGLDFVVPLMDVGEEAEAVVSPRFAYGSRGREPDIPPDSTLFYTVTLISVDPEPEVATLGIAERKEIGNRKKERGNWWYSRDENTLAIQCYRRALDYLDDIENSPDNLNEEEVHNLLEERIKVYNNLAAAQMKIKAYDTALQSVDNVLRCQPNNVKALFRKGKILAEKNEVEKSIECLRLAYSIDQSSDITKKELDRMLNIQKKNSAQERNLYKKMLGTNDNNKQPSTEKPPSSTFQKWGLVVGSVAAVVVGAVAFRYKFF